MWKGSDKKNIVLLYLFGSFLFIILSVCMCYISPGSIGGVSSKPKSFLEIQQEQESDPHHIQHSSSGPQSSQTAQIQPPTNTRQLTPTSKVKVNNFIVYFMLIKYS